jgi:hypothetical protein
MKYLHLSAAKFDDSGKPFAQRVTFREKAFKYGDVIGYECVSRKKRYTVISGKTSSGKSRYLKKLYDNAIGIWSTELRPYAYTKNQKALASRDDRPVFRSKDEAVAWSFPAPVFIPVVSDQAEWLEQSHVAQWWDQCNEQPFKKLKTFEKRAAVVSYLEATRAVLFIDDLDKVPTKKLQFFKDMLNVASRVVVTTTTLTQISQPLRLIIERDQMWMQHFELTTDASFDATHLIMILVVIVCAMSGQWAVAALASTLYALMNRGKFTTKF